MLTRKEITLAYTYTSCSYKQTCNNEVGQRWKQSMPLQAASIQCRVLCLGAESKRWWVGSVGSVLRSTKQAQFPERSAARRCGHLSTGTGSAHGTWTRGYRIPPRLDTVTMGIRDFIAVIVISVLYQIVSCPCHGKKSHTTK